MKIQIKSGFTNISYHDDDLFIQEKKYTGFNHKIDYTLLTNFNFVPQLKFNDYKEIHWQWIDGQEYQVNDQNLVKIATLMKEIHTSKLDFPPSNHAARIKGYQKILNQRKINLPILNKYFKKIHLILKNMDKTTPLHNDLWNRNIIETKNQKTFIVDWEYATKGDKHFDLAYFIESCRLNDVQETILLNAYEDYNYEFLIQHKILVNYLIILWLNVQDIKHFDDQEFAVKIEFLVEQLANYKTKWNLEKKL